MRILMVTDFYWPFVGGVEQHVRSLSHTLHKHGHEVAIATLWSEGLAEIEEDQGVCVYRLRASMQRAKWLFKDAKRPWAPPFPDPEITLGLRKVVKRVRPEIVHGHDWLARSFLPLKRWSGARFVMSLHYYTLTCAKKNLMYRDAPCCGPAFAKCLSCSADHYGVAKGVTTVLMNWASSAAEQSAVDAFVSVSHATGEGNGLHGDQAREHVIPNFLPDNRRAKPHAESDAYLDQLPKGDYMLFVGDLRPMKGLDILLDAYAGLPDAPPLVLIGKVWPDTPAEYPPNTLMLGKWPNDAVLEAWNRAKIGLVPSVWAEPFGIVVIEAMAGGNPVIGSNIGGIPEIVIDGETGILVPPSDSAALRHAMATLLGDDALCRRMGKAAKRRAAEYEASAVVPRIEETYLSVLEK